MLWGCITFYGVGSLVILDGKQDSKKYITILNVGLLPVAAVIFAEKTTWVFQRDSAPIHTLPIYRQWLLQHLICTLP